MNPWFVYVIGGILIVQIECVEVDKNSENIINRIKKELKNIRCGKIDYFVEEAGKEGLVTVVCRIDEEEGIKNWGDIWSNYLKVHLAKALAEFIISTYEERIIAKIIGTNYGYFTKSEKLSIHEKASYIAKNRDENFLYTLLYLRRRNEIVESLIEYLNLSYSIIIEGFVNFRLKGYTKLLEELVDKSVDDFLVEKEYSEFIKLLKYFVSIKESGYDNIHVIAWDHRYILTDNDGVEISDRALVELGKELGTGFITEDDLLISSLVTLAPKHVSLHRIGGFRRKELLTTIMLVFDKKVTICSGCKYCQTKNSDEI